jgi:hypothetical protein
MGWKAVANYVGVSVRTLQRWEQQFHFPVHRVPDGMAYGVKPEIDAWLAQQDARAAMGGHLGDGFRSVPAEFEDLPNVDPCFYVNKHPVAWKCRSCGQLFHASVAMKSHPEDPMPAIRKQIQSHGCAASTHADGPHTRQQPGRGNPASGNPRSSDQ